MSEKICAVVVTHNRLILLQECIEALRNQTRKLDEIIVVNNDSQDGTKEWLDEQSDLTKIHQENLGGAGGFHNGMKLAYEKGYDWIWTMDDDCLPIQDSLEKLITAIFIFPNASFFSSLVIDKNENVSNVPEISESLSPNGYIDYLESIQLDLIKIKSSTFVSTLFNKKSMKHNGFPRKDFFIWGEDSEFTMRLTRASPGYLVFRSKVLHLRFNSHPPNLNLEINKDKLFNYHHLYKNRFYIKFKYYRLSKKILFIFYELPRELFFLLRAKHFKFRKCIVFFHGIFLGIIIIIKEKFKLT